MNFSGTWKHGTPAFGIFISDLSQAVDVAGYKIGKVLFTDAGPTTLDYNIEINRDWRDLTKIVDTEMARYA